MLHLRRRLPCGERIFFLIPDTILLTDFLPSPYFFFVFFYPMQSCEQPPLPWIPSKAFCSVGCFEKYKVSEEGRRLLQEFAILETGYLRPLDRSFTNESLPQPTNKPLRAAPRDTLEHIEDIPVGVSLQDGMKCQLKEFSFVHRSSLWSSPAGRRS